MSVPLIFKTYNIYLTLLLILDIDDCVNHPCKHGGTCIDHVNNFSCQCSQGYRGFLCEKGMFG